MNERVCLSTDPARSTFTELRVGLNSLPYLADHGFQDMVVLPGSFYLQKALLMERDVSGRVPRFVRNVVFQNPVILSPEDTLINIELRDHGEDRIEYIFYEAGGKNGDLENGPGQCVARLEIDRNEARPEDIVTADFSI